MRVLVTGGGGFLGLALCRALRQRGYQVSSINRSDYPALAELEVEQHRADLADFDALSEILRDHDAVFHVAAKAGAWGRFQDYFDANVAGTRNIIAACRMNRVPTLVYTSTPSVAHQGHVPVEGLSAEQAPLARRFRAVYPATKAVAEAAVLEANDDQLATVALRPRLIWGPGDNHLLPRLVERAKADQLRFIGDGSNRIDTTYIDNAVSAHLAAFDHLHGKPDARCAGKAYFISNGEPKPIADVINSLLRAAGAPIVTKTAPFRPIYWLGLGCELVWRWLPPDREPPMTRFIAEQLYTPHWYDIGPARHDLGYQPKVMFIEGIKRLQESLRG